ncbi:ribonuclease T(2) [Rhizobium cremeum]|uniref:ribonuclease T2 family protein n=1 Tax=Rhizobium cremeum TaxID=2813827 RepID=UPI000DDFBD62|nr:ribonuclease T(2) [Rhizobium cremeum]MCJ7994768.1 ribonuclease T(2) [Rhizobium cremeum]MCJ8000236.1 ribonuclease T(2) [Rhizobium cremeum]
MSRYAGFIALALLALAAFAYTAFKPSGTSAPSPAPQESTMLPPAAPSPARLPQGTGFDFYVLALSWSPTFCSLNPGGNNRDQCHASKDYGLVVHGLWPQFERGYPESCASDAPQRVPESIGRAMLDIMPSMGLIGHEWRKHGTCSGLGQVDYFSITRTAYEKVKAPPALSNAGQETRISPEALEKQFLDANRGLEPLGIAVTCEDGKFEEVQICMTKDLEFRTCPEVDRNSCRQRNITIPPQR